MVTASMAICTTLLITGQCFADSVHRYGCEWTEISISALYFRRHVCILRRVHTFPTGLKTVHSNWIFVVVFVWFISWYLMVHWNKIWMWNSLRVLFHFLYFDDLYKFHVCNTIYMRQRKCSWICLHFALTFFISHTKERRAYSVSE